MPSPTRATSGSSRTSSPTRPSCRSSTSRPAEPGASPVARIDEYLTEVLNRKGSDLHFLAGDPPRVRLYGDLLSLRQDRLAPDFVREALYEIMPKKAVERFESKDGTDFAYHLQGVARFRVNVMRHLSGMGAVF